MLFSFSSCSPYVFKASFNVCVMFSGSEGELARNTVRGEVRKGIVGRKFRLSEV